MEAPKKISFNAKAAKEMGKAAFIKTFSKVYGLSEKELSERYQKLVPEDKKKDDPKESEGSDK